MMVVTMVMVAAVNGCDGTEVSEGVLETGFG